MVEDHLAILINIEVANYWTRSVHLERPMRRAIEQITRKALAEFTRAAGADGRVAAARRSKDLDAFYEHFSTP
jgi:hypothetical protein